MSSGLEFLMSDDFSAYHDQQMLDPDYAEAFRRAERELDEAKQEPCPCGRAGCVNWVHPTEGIIGGFGPAGCPL